MSPNSSQPSIGPASSHTHHNGGHSDADEPRPATHTSNEDSDSTDVDLESDLEEIERIATTLSRRGTQISAARKLSRHSTLYDTEDPVLDPQSKTFDASKWLRHFVRGMNAEGTRSKKTGVAFRDLSVSGARKGLQLQTTVSDVLLAPLRVGEMFSSAGKDPKNILHRFDGLLRGGELLVVLGRPGSGCSTFLKSITGELHGLNVGDGSVVHYDGIPQKQMVKEFKGEMPYNQEVDKHFPHLTVGQTLEFAAATRAPAKRYEGMTRAEFSRYVAQVVMAICGLSHTYNTKVGNDFIRGVSGGERKRVSIAEMMVAGSSLCAWDNSTRGLDSATALKFVKSLRLASDLAGSANAVAIYQASQDIYDIFDKATVLYEGRQIYFGPASKAKAFFERQGWACPPRQTTGDFLTSVTNPAERKARPGMEDKVPRTPDDFSRLWRESPEFAALQAQLDAHDAKHPVSEDGGAAAHLRDAKNERQARHVRPGSAYTITIPMQISLTTKRAYQRIWGDKSATLTTFVSNIIISLIVGSLFYGMSDSTASFQTRGAVLFVAILVNALTAISQISSLYAQRPIVEKHASYRFYHPATEAVAGMLSDIPIKFVSAVIFNIILYFLSGLRREPGVFFLFFLITFVSTFVMSAVFKTMAAVTRTVSQAMTGAGVLVLALVIYTGFVIAVPQMHPWFSWIRWINPIFYAFEILVANEFHGHDFACDTFVPAYGPQSGGDSFICSTVGAEAGRTSVSGDAFIDLNYGYTYSHVWRNFGILLAFLVGFMFVYFAATELNSSTSSTAETLVYKRGRVPAHLQPKHGKKGGEDPEAAGGADAVAAADEKAEVDGALEPQRDVFTWTDVTYDVPVKEGTRRLLDGVSGWVKPGTLTALMGVSGAGKTTLLDVLAHRTSTGVITGDMLVNGNPLDTSFQRKTGYVQQQDLHLQTSTVRESLRFSAELRQPRSVPRAEKHAFVEEVINMLGMRDFADAIVGIPGEGLNVEQRKLLSIGVELAAKPKLLLFLDEPTSGLDSQSSWAICSFLRKLADSGQAVLCTIHQPSAILFQEFDRLLFLAKGGKTVYFGEVGPGSHTLLDYFERNGARKCEDEENPAEYILEQANNGTNDRGEDWNAVWNASPENRRVAEHLGEIHDEMRGAPRQHDPADHHADGEFAAPFAVQLAAVTRRVFQQYWRTPSYVFAKWILSVAAGLFIGFSFYQSSNSGASLASMSNIIFGVFMVTTVFSTLVHQIQPVFITQRALYEVRERPSKAYSWKAFLLANVFVEIPFQIVAGILIFACVYYPIAGVQSSERQGLVLLFMIQFFIYASTFSHMTIAALPDEETAGAIVTLLVMMSLMFCGVLQSPDLMPGFWIFMYRVSPFTYWIAGIVSTQLHGRPVDCSATETSIFSPPSGQTCGEYMAPYLQQAPGALQNPDATSDCRFCAVSVADEYLEGSNIFWDERWRNFGIVWAYVAFNIAVAVATYYAFRVAKWKRPSFGKKSKK